MEQLNLFKDTGYALPIKDPILKLRVKSLRVKSGFNPYSQINLRDIHEIGIEKKESHNDNIPAIVGISGFGHGNWSFIKLMEVLAPFGIEFRALSPYGEEQSADWKKPVGQLTIEDYLQIYRQYLFAFGKEVVLLGHSLGGLQAQILATEFRNQVKGLILINTVKPSNICKRTFSEADKEGLIYKPKEKMKKVLEELFCGRFPQDIGWIIERLMKSTAYNNVIDSYAGKAGEVDPQKITVPLMEFSGELDEGETTGVFLHKKEDGDEDKNNNIDFDYFEEKDEDGEPCVQLVETNKYKIRELQSFVSGRRIAVSDFFLKKGRCPFADFQPIHGGSHNSLILGDDAAKVGEHIGQNYCKLFL